MPSDNVVLIGDLKRQVYRLSDGQLTSETFTKPTSQSWQELRTGASAKRDPYGWRKPTAYESTVQLVRYPRGVLQYKDSTSRVVQTGVYPGVTMLPPAKQVPAWLRTRAEVDALLKLKDQNIDLGVAFAERGATARMVGDVATRIAKAYREARKRNFRKAASELGVRYRKSTSNWLELQYGWKPLLSDVYGSCQALADSRYAPHQWQITVKGVSREEESNFSKAFNGGAQFYYEDRYFFGSFVRLDYFPDNVFLIALSSLGLTNPLVIAWELKPLSFVVDWMLPIGDWLSSLDAANGYTFRGGSRSDLSRRSRVVIPTTAGGTLSGQTPEWNNMLGGKGRRVELNRSVYTSSPLPRPPVPKNPASLGHMANGLSLLAEAFGRRR